MWADIAADDVVLKSNTIVNSNCRCKIGDFSEYFAFSRKRESVCVCAHMCVCVWVCVLSQVVINQWF